MIPFSIGIIYVIEFARFSLSSFFIFKSTNPSSPLAISDIFPLICFLELAYVYCLRYFYNKILAYVLYKLYFICHFYILLFIYFYCYNVAKKKKYANLKEMFKDSKRRYYKQVEILRK